MKESKEHLNVDLEFLDKEEPIRVAPKQPDSHEGKTPNAKHKWSGGLIWAIIILFFIGVGAIDKSGNNSNSSTNSNYSAEEGGNGQWYNCSSYNSDRADELKPTITEKEIEAESLSLDKRAAEIEKSATTIDTTHIDENDDIAVALYNASVGAHNAKLKAYQQDAELYNEKFKKFNEQVDAYNNYLQANCTKR